VSAFRRTSAISLSRQLIDGRYQHAPTIEQVGRWHPSVSAGRRAPELALLSFLAQVLNQSPAFVFTQALCVATSKPLMGQR
jgi:hypothetical protein